MQRETRGDQAESTTDHLPREVRVAVVRHEQSAEGDHLDLFVGPRGAAADARVARSWRLPLEAWRSEGLATGRFAAVPTPAHRAAYLELDGSTQAPRELSGGRGRVVPLVAGDGVTDDDGAVTALGRVVRFTRDAVGNCAVEIANDGPRRVRA